MQQLKHIIFQNLLNEPRNVIAFASQVGVFQYIENLISDFV